MATNDFKGAGSPPFGFGRSGRRAVGPGLYRNIYDYTVRHAYAKQIFIASGTTTTLPADWNPYDNLVECYGSGVSGVAGSGTSGGRGGGGGSYAASYNLNVAAGATVNLVVGVIAGPTDTAFNATSLANAISNGVGVSVGAQGASAATGGRAESSVGNIKNSGGDGATSGAGLGGGAGGGAGGPNGPGKNGGPSPDTGVSGNGGGGCNGGFVGNANGGAGGNGRTNAGGGSANGGNATANLGGGGGGGNGGSGSGTAGGTGALDNVYADGSHGPGGGGAGGGTSTGIGTGGNGGAGGGFGSGGGGGGGGSGGGGVGALGAGQPGFISLQYNPLMVLDTASFIHTYNAATFAFSRPATADAASFAHTYNPVTMAAVRRLATAAWNGPASGLTHRWPMDDAHISGSTVTDVVGSLNGTIVGGVTSATGPITQARAFNGSTGYITLASGPFTVTSAFTVGLWVYFDDITLTGNDGGDPTILQFNDGTTQWRMLNASSSFTPGYFGANDNLNNGDAAQAFTSATWQHIAVTFDGASTYKLYLNGNPLTGAGSGFFSTIAANEIGGRGVASRLMKGRQYQLVTYSRALSPSEVQSLFYAESITGLFVHTYNPAIITPGVVAQAATYMHVYMAAGLSFTTTRRIQQITKPVNRQIVDPTTGMLTHEWQLKITQMIDVLNKIQTDRNQS